jgi:hypothetical protein
MAIVVATVVSLFQIPCPKCHKPLGRIGFRAANAGGLAAAGRCPHCGVSFDEQVPEKR